MRRVFGIFGIVAGIGVAAYIIVALIANFAIFKKEDTGPKLPAVEEAKTVLTIKANGVSYLTNDYEVLGTTVGSRVFLLHSFWEQSGKAFRLRERELILDEKIYGPIEIYKRQIPKTTSTKGG